MLKYNPNKRETQETNESQERSGVNMKDKTLTDIMLICKGWYNKEKYKTLLEALNAYYHKHYGCEDITMNKAFAQELFLKPLVLEAIKRKPALARYIFEPTLRTLSDKDPFVEAMYDRSLGLIQMIEHNTFDLSEYETMLEKAKTCNYEDETIGII